MSISESLPCFSDLRNRFEEDIRDHPHDENGLVKNGIHNGIKWEIRRVLNMNTLHYTGYLFIPDTDPLNEVNWQWSPPSMLEFEVTWVSYDEVLKEFRIGFDCAHAWDFTAASTQESISKTTSVNTFQDIKNVLLKSIDNILPFIDVNERSVNQSLFRSE